jgi:large subunit ribosomal protein L4
MPEAKHYTAAAEPKGAYALPAEFDGTVAQGALYHAVRAFRNNQRQGNAYTKTRAEVSGGNQKPWKQKGTGRARQGSTRAVQWVGGGVAHGPRPRSYTTPLNRKVRQLARRSAFNQRAAEGAIHVIEDLTFETPKTQLLHGLLDKLGLREHNVLVLTAGHKPNVYLSGRNLDGVAVQRYEDAAAYDVLWARALVIEESALGGHHVDGSEAKAKKATTRQKRVTKASGKVAKRAATKATKATKKSAKTTKATKQVAKKATKSSKKKGR